MASSKNLYALPVPTDSLVETSSRQQRQISSQGSVGASGSGSVTPVSTEPGQRSLRGAYRSGNPAAGALMAGQLEQLFGATGIEYVPFYSREGSSDADGYYSLEDIDVNRAHPNSDSVQEFDGKLTKAGTQKSHVRAVHTAPTSVDTAGASEFSNSDPPARTELVCLPTDARRVRWFDPVSGTVAPAAPLNRYEYPEQAGEFVNHRWYDLADAPFYDPSADAPSVPTLVYECPYGREHKMDVRVWDTAPDVRGATKVIEGEYAGGAAVGGPDAVVGSAQVGGSPTEATVDVASAWQHVYRTDHDFSDAGECVLDNGVLRLRLDDDRGAITAQRSRGHFDDWAGQPLRTSKWVLRDFDIAHIGLARADAQLAFEHGDTGERYALDVSLPRGYDGAIFTVAQNQSGAPPYGLSQKLAPVAKFGQVTVRTPVPSAGLVAREELRR
jgi:hypothetical protein